MGWGYYFELRTPPPPPHHIPTWSRNTIIQSTLPKSFLHKSNNCLSRRSIQVLFSLYSIVFNPLISQIFSKSKLFLQSQQIRLRQSWLYFSLGKILRDWVCESYKKCIICILYIFFIHRLQVGPPQGTPSGWVNILQRKRGWRSLSKNLLIFEKIEGVGETLSGLTIPQNPSERFRLSKSISNLNLSLPPPSPPNNPWFSWCCFGFHLHLHLYLTAVNG